MDINKLPPGVRVGENTVKDEINSSSVIANDFSVSPVIRYSSGDILIDESGYYVLVYENEIQVELE